MDGDRKNKPNILQRDLDDERPGFTPGGRREEGAEQTSSTTDDDQASALGGKVATRSKVDQDD